MIRSSEEYDKMVEESRANNALKTKAQVYNPNNGDQKNYKKFQNVKKTQASESRSYNISTVVHSGNEGVITKVSPSVVMERMGRLNEFEKQVFEKYRQGVQTAKMAYELGVSRSTINRALQNLKIKLEINSTDKNEILYKAHYELGLEVSNEVKAMLNDWTFRKRKMNGAVSQQATAKVNLLTKEPKNFYYPGM